MYWKADKKYKVKKVESRSENDNINYVIRYYYTVTLEEIIETPVPTPDPAPTPDPTPTPTPPIDDDSTPSDNNTVSNDGTSDEKSSDKKSSDEKTEIEYIDPFREFLDDMGQRVLNAPENGNVLVQTDIWVCFNRKALETLKTRPDVSLTVEYRYEGKYYTLTIPAGYDVETLLDENGYAGFRWVDQFVGGHEIIK